MIVVKLIGGLGNQLFQYAAGRQLADIHNTVLKLDLSEFESYKLHNYALNAFTINASVISDEELTCLAPVKEKHFHFDPDFRNAPDNALLTGYWQSEKYFSEIEDVLRDELQLKANLVDADLQILDKISAQPSVSLHIRRGDYVKNTYSDQILTSLDLGYYERAVGYLTSRIANCQFFVFSDDPYWVKENFSIDFPVTYVAHNTAATNYADLILMSQCDHNIICNSSFSWWGAWLNSNPDKIVCAPDKWFNENARHLNSQDLIPARWTEILS